MLVDGDPYQPNVASTLSAGPVDGAASKRTTGDAAVCDATAPVTQPSTRTAESPDVQVVPAPPRPPIELIVIADDYSDAGEPRQFGPIFTKKTLFNSSFSRISKNLTFSEHSFFVNRIQSINHEYSILSKALTLLLLFMFGGTTERER